MVEPILRDWVTRTRFRLAKSNVILYERRNFQHTDIVYKFSACLDTGATVDTLTAGQSDDRRDDNDGERNAQHGDKHLAGGGIRIIGCDHLRLLLHCARQSEKQASNKRTE